MSTHARGLTLLELVVVLAIIAVLSTVALRTTAGVGDQTRYRATQKSLEELEAAIRGETILTNAGDNEVQMNFVQDIGRLPRAYDDVPASPDPLRQLRELWTNDKDFDGVEDIVPFAIQSPAGDSDIRMGTGWRGPYLRLGLGSENLRDGWGRPLELLNSALASVSHGEEVAAVASFGQDALPGGSGYEADMELDFVGMVTGTVEGRVYFDAMSHPMATSGTMVIVRVYTPDPVTGVPYTHFQDEIIVSGGPVAYSLPDVPTGERVFRAYQFSPGGALELDPDFNQAARTVKSRPLRVFVPPGGRTLDLILRTD